MKNIYLRIFLTNFPDNYINKNDIKMSFIFVNNTIASRAFLKVLNYINKTKHFEGFIMHNNLCLIVIAYFYFLKLI